MTEPRIGVCSAEVDPNPPDALVRPKPKAKEDIKSILLACEQFEEKDQPYICLEVDKMKALMLELSQARAKISRVKQLAWYRSLRQNTTDHELGFTDASKMFLQALTSDVPEDRIET